MDLRTFISETLRAIANATRDAQEELEPHGFIVNPPVHANTTTYDPGGNEHHRQIREVDFDVAVTAGDTQSAGGEAGIRVWGAGLGGKASAEQMSETVSRVRFSIPVVLPPTSEESTRRVMHENETRKLSEGLKARRRVP